MPANRAVGFPSGMSSTALKYRYGANKNGIRARGYDDEMGARGALRL